LAGYSNRQGQLAARSGPRGSDVEAIIETSGLACLMTASHIDDMVSFLKEVMSGETPGPRYPEAYAWPNLIKKLDIVLRKSIAGSPGNVAGINS
jgi:hypothetical protein